MTTILGLVDVRRSVQIAKADRTHIGGYTGRRTCVETLLVPGAGSYSGTHQFLSGAVDSTSASLARSRFRLRRSSLSRSLSTSANKGLFPPRQTTNIEQSNSLSSHDPRAGIKVLVAKKFCKKQKHPYYVPLAFQVCAAGTLRHEAIHATGDVHGFAGKYC